MSEKQFKREILLKEKPSLKSFLSRNSMWGILLALFVMMTLIQGLGFIRLTNLVSIVQNEANIGILALGVAFTIISRGIDLSVGSILTLSACVSAAFAQQVDPNRLFGNFATGFPPFLAPLVGLLLGLLLGAMNGWLIAYTKIHPFIATLGTMSAARGLAGLITDGQPVSRLAKIYNTLGGGKLFRHLAGSRFPGVDMIVLFFVIFCIVAWFILTQTRFGRNIYAIGGNESAARVAGVKVEKNLVAVYAWSGLCAGAAGVLMAGRVASATPTIGFGLELDAIAAATIGGVSQTGGVGRVSGIVSGVLILGVVRSALVFLGLSPYYQEIAKGVIIVIAVIVDMHRVRKNGG